MEKINLFGIEPEKRIKIEVDFDKLYKSDDLIIKLMRKSKSLLTTEKWPIAIPSCDRPNNKVASLLRKHNSTWPVIYVVSESQYKDYSEALSDLSNVQVVAYPDSEMMSEAEARQKILDLSYDHIFMFDDDISDFCFSHLDFSVLSAKPKVPKHKAKIFDFDSMMATWQLLTMWTEEYFPELEIYASCIGNSGNLGFISTKELVRVGKLGYVSICFNSALLRKHDIVYDKNVIAEDTDLHIQCLQKHLIPICCECFGHMSPENGMSKTTEERYKEMADAYEELVDKYPTFPLVKSDHGVKMNSREYRKSLGVVSVYLPNNYVELKLK